DFYERNAIHRIYTRVVAVDAARAEVWCSTSPESTKYDALLIASGSRARAPSFDGAYFPGVLTLRTIADARQVYDAVKLRGLKSALVLGGGALGLEWAHALLEHGVKVTLMERAPRFLPGALDEVGSDLLATRLRKGGIEVILGDEVRMVHPGPNGSAAGVTTLQGRTIHCEIVAAALGVVPNTEFLASAGLSMAKNGAVNVDNGLRASAGNVWAAGDVANVAGEWLALWEPARRQARIAAENMAGGKALYRPGVHYFATRLFDLDFARAGNIERTPGSEELVDFPRGTGQIAYRKLVLNGGRLQGALMLGERSQHVRAIGRNMKHLIDAGVDVSEVKHRLLDASFDCEAWLEKKRLVERPKAPQGTKVIDATKLKEANLKRTRFVSLGAMMPGGTSVLGATGTGPMTAVTGGTAMLDRPSLVAASEQSGRTTALPSASPEHGTTILPSAGPRATKVLSIGLRAEAPVENERSSLAPIDARIDAQGRSWPIVATVSNLGQAPDCQIQLADPALSAHHAQILRYATGLYLRDLGSNTGTWLNGQGLSAVQPLFDGDRIRLGQLELVFRSRALVRSNALKSEESVAGPQLEVRSGRSLGLGFALGKQAVLIGTGPECAIRLTDPGISPRHAQLRSNGTAFYVSDAGSHGGTFVGGTRLGSGQEVALGEGSWLRVGAVDLLFTTGPHADAMARLRPQARVCIDSGSDAGKSAAVAERLIVGSGPRAGLVLQGAAPEHLEFAAHDGRFWVRDLSGGRAFRAGAPLAAEFREISNGELLLLSGTIMVRFEEAS
ncbi:MAG TPA: FAD-dependent oxidoreductase, partial [Polyangiaceae bacterium]